MAPRKNEEEEARSSELSGADLKSETDPQPEDQGETSTATLKSGTKVSGPSEVVKRLKNQTQNR